jgi:hypothetical protein
MADSKARQHAEVIRRQIETEANRQFLRSFPAFKIDPKTPDHLRELLTRLDQAEREQKHH